MRSSCGTQTRAKSRAIVTSSQKGTLWPQAAQLEAWFAVAQRPSPEEGYALQAFETLVLETPRILPSKPPCVNLGPTKRMPPTYQSSNFGDLLAARRC